MAQVQQAVHVGVGEVAKELPIGHLLPCMKPSVSHSSPRGCTLGMHAGATSSAGGDGLVRKAKPSVGAFASKSFSCSQTCWKWCCQASMSSRRLVLWGPCEGGRHGRVRIANKAVVLHSMNMLLVIEIHCATLRDEQQASTS